MSQKYKLSINDKLLTIHEDSTPSEQLIDSQKLDINCLKNPQAAIENIANSPDSIFHLQGKPKSIFQSILDSFQVISAAGGLVHNDQGELLMIYRRGFWDLPKGKIEKGESKEEAALREVEEECGIHNLKLGAYHGNTYHFYIYRGAWVLKESIWFQMKSNETNLVPQTEEDIEQVEWVTKTRWQKLRKHTYETLRETIDSGFGI